MLRPAIFATLFVTGASLAAAQQAGELDVALPDTEASDYGGVDFLLRPSQEPGDPIDGSESDAPDTTGSIPQVIGPPLLGPEAGRPSGDEVIGPPLAGPPLPILDAPIRAPRAEDDTDPFAPVGVKLGSFILRPAIEIGVSATDNVGSDGEGEEESAVGLVVAPQLNILSEDERHRIEADLIGEAIIYGDKEFDEREGEARVKARYDLTSRTSVNAEAAYSTDLDSYSDPDTPDAAAERPAVHDMEAALGVTQLFGRLGFGVGATVEREVHDEVTLANGETASREDLDNTEYAVFVRTSYEASAAATPFATIGAGRREYDVEVDSDGFERSSLWGEMRGGLLFNFGSKLNGEVAIGIRREDLDDDELEDLNAIVADASIFWSPRRLTDIRVEFSTDVRPTGIPGASGSILYSGGIAVARRIGARFRLEAGTGVDYENFVGAGREDLTLSASAGLSYAFNRHASAVARYSYERTDSSDPGGDFDENVIGVRLRIQR